jgi:tRNA(Ile2) C34 agmatinyltransferase TiaS
MFMTCETRKNYEKKIEKLEADYKRLLATNNSIYRDLEEERRYKRAYEGESIHLRRKVKDLEYEIERKGERESEEKRKGEINHTIQKLEELRDKGGSVDLMVGVDENVSEYNVAFTVLHETGGAINLDKVRRIYEDALAYDYARFKRWGGRGRPYKKVTLLTKMEEMLEALGLLDKVKGRKGGCK